MTIATRKIEIEETTALALEKRAAEAGVSIAEFVTRLVEREPVKIPAGQVTELDRRWKAVKEGGRTIAQDDVVRWLETWGTPGFRPWRG